jgi:hypothetical protein
MCRGALRTALDGPAAMDTAAMDTAAMDTAAMDTAAMDAAGLDMAKAMSAVGWVVLEGCMGDLLA